MTEQEIKKEAILQMNSVFWNFDDGIIKDLDDYCEDIYNEVFVPLLKQTRKETAKEILQEVGKVCGDYQWFKNLCKQFGMEVCE